MSQVPTSSASAPLAGVAICTMFRGSPDQLLQWCNFHLGAGAEKVYVVLDSPDEALVSTLPEHDRVEWQVTGQAMWDAFHPWESQNVEQKQVDAFRWIAQRAHAEGHEFLAFVDADELLMLDQPFSRVAADHPEASAYTFPVKEMWYAAGDPITEPFGASLALRRTTGRGVRRDQAFGWRAQFLRNGVMGHDAGKSVYRLPLISGEMTVHEPRTGAAAARRVTLPPTSGSVLHFDCGNLATWNHKWGSRLQATRATGLGPRRQAQQQLFSHPLRESPEEQARFFTDFFSLDQESQDLLAADGALEQIRVADLVAGPLAVPTRIEPELIRVPTTARRVDFQFALVGDRRFVRPTFATMVSVVSQLGEKGSIRFVVLGDGLTASDQLHLRSIEHTGFDVEVHVHDITSDLDRDVGTEDPKRATFGRIYLIDHLPVQRTIYLDGDVLATRDFSELFDRDLEGACFAGVPDSAALRLVADPAGVPVQQRNRLLGITDGDPLDYLNGGVLILDLDHPGFRERALVARGLVVTQGRALKQRDQDAMNIAFAGSKHRLESSYNYMTQFYASDRTIDGDLIERKYAYADATLVHFSGRIKPWDEPDAEFYNGLYRKLVSEAERKVGASCGFYFSQLPPTQTRAWDTQRWTDTLRTAAPAPEAKPTSVSEKPLDLDVLELRPDCAYVTVTSEFRDLIRGAGLQLSGFVDGRRVFDAPLDRLGPPIPHLNKRVARGVRLLPVDLSAALQAASGEISGLQLALTLADDSAYGGFRRPVGVRDLVVDGSAQRSRLLGELGVDGALESFSGGWVTGWFRPSASGDRAEKVALFIDGELAARRRADVRRDDLPKGSVGFRFNVANLLRMGYGSGGAEVTVVVAGHNVPLSGAPFSLTGVEGDLVRDASTGEWSAPPEPARSEVATERARRLAGRVRRRFSKDG